MKVETEYDLFLLELQTTKMEYTQYLSIGCLQYNQVNIIRKYYNHFSTSRFVSSFSITKHLLPLKSDLESFVSPLLSKMTWLNPSLLSLLGLISMLNTSIFLYWSLPYIYIFGFLLLSVIFDSFDGMLARAQKRASIRGRFIDSTIDRVGEIIFFIALFHHPLFTPSAVMILGLSAILSNYLQFQIYHVGGVWHRSLLDKPERSIYFLIVFFLLGFANFMTIGWTIWVMVTFSIIANGQYILLGIRQPRIYKLSTPTSPDTTTYDPDYSDEYYIEAT